MSTSNVRPILVHVLGSDGKELGTARLRPTGCLWRSKGAPSIRIGDRTAQCERHEKGWALRLLPGEAPPNTRRPTSAPVLVWKKDRRKAGTAEAQTLYLRIRGEPDQAVAKMQRAEGGWFSYRKAPDLPGWNTAGALADERAVQAHAEQMVRDNHAAFKEGQ